MPKHEAQAGELLSNAGSTKGNYTSKIVCEFNSY